MVKTFGTPRECGAPGQLPLLPPPLSGPGHKATPIKLPLLARVLRLTFNYYKYLHVTLPP